MSSPPTLTTAIHNILNHHSSVQFNSHVQLEDGTTCYLTAQILSFNEDPYKNATHRATQDIISGNNGGVTAAAGSPTKISTSSDQQTFGDTRVNLVAKKAALATINSKTLETKYSSLLNSKNVLFHEAVRPVVSPTYVSGPHSPDEFKEKIRSLFFSVFASDTVFQHVRACCGRSSKTDAVGFLIETESPLTKQRDVIGGSVLALVDSEAEYSRDSVQSGKPSSYAQRGFSRVWLPLLLVSKYDRYDQYSLATRFIKNIFVVIGKLVSRNAFGEFLKGIDCRLPASLWTRKVMKEAGFAPSKTLGTTMTKHLKALPRIKNGSSVSDEEEEEEEEESSISSSEEDEESTPPRARKQTRGRPKKTTITSKKSATKVKADAAVASKSKIKKRKEIEISSSDSDEESESEQLTKNTKKRTNSKNKKNKKVNDEEETNVFLGEDRMRLCRRLPDGIGGQNSLIRFRLAHKDDATEWKGIVSSFARETKQDLKIISEKSFYKSDLRVVAYIHQPDEDEKYEHEFFKNHVIDETRNSASKKDKTDDDDDEEEKNFKSVPFRSAASFTPVDEYVNRYNNYDDEEKACRIFDASKSRYGKQEDDIDSPEYKNNKKKNNKEDDDSSLSDDEDDENEEEEEELDWTQPETLPLQTVIHKILDEKNFNDTINNQSLPMTTQNRKKNNDNNNSQQNNNNNRRHSHKIKTAIVGLISIEANGHIPFVWVHDLLRKRGVGTLLIAIAAEWLRVRQLLLTFADKTESYPILVDARTNSFDIPENLDKCPLGWIPLGEKWNLLERASPNDYYSKLAKKLPKISSEMQKKVDEYDAILEQKKTEFRSQAVVIPGTKPKIVSSNNKVTKNQKGAAAASSSKNNSNKKQSTTAVVPGSSANGHHQTLQQKQASSSNNNTPAFDPLNNLRDLPLYCMQLLFGPRVLPTSFSNQQQQQIKNNGHQQQQLLLQQDAAAADENNNKKKNATVVTHGTSRKKSGTTQNNNKQKKVKTENSTNPWSRQDTRIITTSENENDIAFLKSRLVSRFSLAFGRDSMIYRVCGDPFVAEQRESFSASSDPDGSSPSGPHETIFITCSLHRSFDEEFGGVNDCHATKFPTETELRTDAGKRKLATIEKVYLLSCLKQVTFRRVNNTPSSPSSPTIVASGSSSFTSQQQRRVPQITMDLEPAPPSLLLAQNSPATLSRKGRVMTPEKLSLLEVSLLPLNKKLCTVYENLKFTYDIPEDLRKKYKNDPEGLKKAIFGGAGGENGISSSANAKSGKKKYYVTANESNNNIPQMTRTIQLFAPQLPCALGELVPQLDFDFLSLVIPDWNERIRQRQAQKEKLMMTMQNQQQQQQLKSTTTESKMFVAGESGKTRQREE